MQVLWLLRLALPDDRPIGVASFVVLALVELAIPIWAERAAPAQQFHPGHIAERFGLFTIIVLGEVILSSTIAVREAIDAVGLEFGVLVVAAAALVIAFAVWWSYFGRDDEPEVDRLHGAFFWGYGHLPVFAGLAAFGAGVHVAVEAAAGSADVTDRVAALAVTVPLAVAIVGFTISVANARSTRERRLLPVEAVKFAVVLLLGLLAPLYVAIVGTAVLFVAGTIVQGIVLDRRLGVEVATIVSNDDADRGRRPPTGRRTVDTGCRDRRLRSGARRHGGVLRRLRLRHGGLGERHRRDRQERSTALRPVRRPGDHPPRRQQGRADSTRHTQGVVRTGRDDDGPDRDDDRRRHAVRRPADVADLGRRRGDAP